MPDVARREFVNVAVIVGRDGADWAIQSAPDLRRVSRLGGSATALRPWLVRFESALRDHESPPFGMFADPEAPVVSRAWLELVSHRYNNALQLSDVAPIMAESAIEGASFLYETFIAIPEPRRRTLTRRRLVQDLSSLYRSSAPPTSRWDLLPSPRAMVGRQRGRFDFAVVDDRVVPDRVDQLSQVFAFDLRDIDALERDIQAWNFIARTIRDHGATIARERRPVPVSTDVQIAVAYQVPEVVDGQRGDVIGAALEAWDELNIRAFPSSQMQEIARDAAALVVA